MVLDLWKQKMGKFIEVNGLKIKEFRKVISILFLG
jgi:hypothetical protein